jgi:MFS superfamily sulfate permease-like transporter
MIFVGVEQGIIMEIVLSLLLHVRHSYRPNKRKDIYLDSIDLHF